MNSAHTLLRYPGGKSRAVKTIAPMLEDIGGGRLVSPFFGGGSIEFGMLQRGWKVIGYDGWEPLVNFWDRVLKDSGRVADIVDMLRPVGNPAYTSMQKGYADLSDPWMQAAVFYALNRCAHTGTGMTGGKTNWRGKPGDKDYCTDACKHCPANPRLGDGPVKKLRAFDAPKLKIKCADFTESLSKHDGELFYLDPPYVTVGKMLYDHSTEEFDHVKLADMLHSRDKWVLSYNNVEEVRDLYSGYPVLHPEWKYGIKRNSSTEVLIFSKDLESTAKDFV
jgi:DNA adenine methylase